MRVFVLAGLAVSAVVSHAWADPSAREAADRLAGAAHANQDVALLDRCGSAYLDLYNQTPTAADNDQVLFGAGVCFEEAHSVSAALQAYGLILKYYPRSPLVIRATLASAHVYASIAFFDRAAALLETYAKKYAAEKDAADALAQAIEYRAGLGDPAKQIEDTRVFTRTFGHNQPAAAAAHEYALVALYPNPDDAIAQLRAYLAAFGKTDAELAGLAHAQLGDLLWARSCSVRPSDGLCVVVSRQRAAHCGDDDLERVVAVKRGATARPALDEDREAIAVLAKAPASARGRHAAAMAKLALADAALEQLLATAFPSDLDFDPEPAHRAVKEKSLQRFDRWLHDEIKGSTAVAQQYAGVLEMKDVDSSVAAALRLGQTAQAFWRALLAGEIPRSVLRGPFANETHAAYCDELKVVAEPLGHQMVEAFETCLEKSVELAGGWTWAGACAREASRWVPDLFPPLRELHGTARESPAPYALEPALQ